MRSTFSTLKQTSCCIAILLLATTLRAQERDESTMEGTVVSATRETMVIRGDDNTHQLFVFERRTQRPRAIPAGSRVSVVSIAGDEPGVRRALSVSVLSAAPQGQSQAGGQAPAPPPREVRELERDIERQVRRWRLGVRGGVALDPELISFGVQSRIGPIFTRNVTFRPNAEFSWGEVTDMIGLNLDVAYRLPITTRQGRWNTYVGVGPALNFVHQNFEREAGEDRDIDFGNFEFDTALNVMAGVEFRRGTFMEVRTGIYAGPAPTFRVIFGYNF
jgi:hypothetical protein